MNPRQAQGMEIAGLRVHVIGLGGYGTGREVARALSARGALVTVSDAKPASELSREIELLQGAAVRVQTGEEAYRGIEQAELVVPSPGVPLNTPPLLRAREHGARIVSEIEVAWWLARCPIIAVTGTKGKSTTTTLIGEILRDEGRAVHVGGNIGRPLVAIAERAGPGEVIAAEVSSFQLEATEEFRPAVAVLLNLLPDHLDRHATMGDYRAAKGRLFANQQPGDAAVVNRDDPAAWALGAATKAEMIPFSIAGEAKEGADLDAGWLRVRGRRICEQRALRLRGRHNLANALAALAAAQAAGASLDRAAETLSRFQGLEHRLETVGEVGGVLYVNDSQATTPEAAAAAVEAFAEHVVLIAGGRAKVEDFSRLARALAARGAELVVMGEAAGEIAAAASAAGATVVGRASSLPEAVRMARDRTRPGDVVLLSPACASFDMFADMADRGRMFKGLVKSLEMQERTDHT